MLRMFCQDALSALGKEGKRDKSHSIESLMRSAAARQTDAQRAPLLYADGAKLTVRPPRDSMSGHPLRGSEPEVTGFGYQMLFGGGIIFVLMQQHEQRSMLFCLGIKTPVPSLRMCTRHRRKRSRLNRGRDNGDSIMIHHSLALHES